jgi:hypothetical protein
MKEIIQKDNEDLAEIRTTSGYETRWKEPISYIQEKQ